jgi:Cytochrome c biogenesis factor
MYFLSVILIGTVYPIFLEVISSNKISVGPPFYNKLIIPFLIPFLLAMAIGPRLKWIKSEIQNKISLILFLVISLLLSFFILKSFDRNFLLNSILLGAAFYLFLTTLRDFIIRSSKNISQNMAHFGFSLLILSILLNNIFSTEVITNLKIGETVKTKNFTIVFQSVEQKDQKNFKSIIGKIMIKDFNEETVVLNPELRIYNQPNIVTSEADIKTNLIKDRFITMNSVPNQNYFNIRYQVKPLMIWIWFSVIIISIAGLISLYGSKYEN